MTTVRSYQSPLREAQAALTRERIMMAAKGYLERHDIENLTLRQIAELSGVSPPTVYAHFPTMDDLVAAFFHWLRPRLGLDEPWPPLAEMSDLPRRLFPRYEEYGALLRNLMNKPSWDRQRANDRSRRHGGWLDAVKMGMPHLTPEQARRGGLAVAAYWSPTHWRWLRDTCSFNSDEAQDVASWAMRVLIEALKRDPSTVDVATPRPANHVPMKRRPRKDKP